MLRNFALVVLGADQVLAGQKQDSCLALALNGGGAKGAYQAGAIWGWTHYGNPEDFQWDVVTGISGGAINTGAMSVWAKEDAYEMAQWVSDQWENNLTTPKVWKFWPGGLREGLTTAVSLVDSSPLLEFMTETLAPFGEVKRHAIVGTVDINNGEYITYRLDEATWDTVPSKTVSSASLPALFIPMQIDGHVNVDGGTFNGLDAVSAVQKCMELVDDYSQVTLDVILLDKFTEPMEEVDVQTSLANLTRGNEIKAYYSGLENVIEVMVTYPEINYRYLLEPSGPYPSGINLLNFSTRNTWPLQENGRADAQTCLDYGAGYGYDSLFDTVQEHIYKLDEYDGNAKKFASFIVENFLK